MAATAVREGLDFGGLRRLFYLVSPSESSFPTVEAVPPYVDLAIVWFLISMALELTINCTTGKSYRHSPNDSFTSMGGGLMQSCVKVLFRSVEFSLYCMLYENFHLADLAWNSKWTWILSFLCVDFGYYWFHRFGHESMIGWSSHQMHHSSEYYNLSTALRQGMLQQFVSMFFYFPFALFIPPPIHLVHTCLNLIYQFWIHTEIVDRLGPLEWVINTPSHHRVHHGRNPYCIDKNYAGTLIIWDRIFGTFQEEKTDEPVVYGLVHNVSTFNQLYCQLFVLKETFWDKPRSLGGWWNKLQTPFRGPGWEPGVIRTGPADGIPDVKQIEYPVVRYNPVVPIWISVYVFLHFLVCLAAYMHVSTEKQSMVTEEMLVYVSFVAISLQCFGAFFDKKSYAGFLELTRCSAVYCCLAFRYCTPTGVLHYVFALSACLWVVNLLNCLRNGSVKEKSV